MKKTLFICAVLTLLLAISSLQCKSSGTSCNDVFCTQYVASVGVHIEDRSMTPEALTVYTIRKSTGEKIAITQNPLDGIYIVLADNYHLKIAGRTETFTFVGMKGSTKIFSETYQIKADCCHVSKVSGKDSLIIP